jgi:hypothetical protein
VKNDRYHDRLSGYIKRREGPIKPTATRQPNPKGKFTPKQRRRVTHKSKTGFLKGIRWL